MKPTMDRQLILDKVTKTMAELFDLDRSKLSMDSRFEDLEITSLDAIDLLVELQSQTGRKVSGAGLRQIRTIGDLVLLIEAHLAQANAGPVQVDAAPAQVDAGPKA